MAAKPRSMPPPAPEHAPRQFRGRPACAACPARQRAHCSPAAESEAPVPLPGKAARALEGRRRCRGVPAAAVCRRPKWPQ